MRARDGHAARVALGRPGRANAATEYIADAPTLKARTPFANGARSSRRRGRRVSSHSFVACCTQNPADEIANSCAASRSDSMRDREERNAVKLDALDPRVGVEDHVEEEMAALVGSQPDRNAPQELTDRSSPIHTLWGLVLSSLADRGGAATAQPQLGTAVSAIVATVERPGSAVAHRLLNSAR